LIATVAGSVSCLEVEREGDNGRDGRHGVGEHGNEFLVVLLLSLKTTDFCQANDINRFKLTLRDFLIQLKEFAGDNAELFIEDRENAAKEAKVQERERAMKVGGLLKPSEIDDDEL